MIWVDFIRDEESKLMNENDELINELFQETNDGNKEMIIFTTAKQF